MKNLYTVAFGVFLLVILAVPINTQAYGSLSLEQSSVNLNIGESRTLNFYPPSNQMASITFQSNTSVVSASIAANNKLILSGLNNGWSEVRLCTPDNTCGTVNVNVGSGGGSWVGGISISPSYLTMNVGETRYATVNIPYLSSPYLGSNSNDYVASATISGNTISVYGKNSGNTSVSVCASNSTCVNLPVTVSGSNYQDISFSQNNVNLNFGESKNISIYGTSSSNYNISSNSNPSVVSASVSGSTIYLYATNNSGSATILVCGSFNNCGTLYVTVNSGGIGGMSVNPSNLSLNVGETKYATVNVPYLSTPYISSNSQEYVASATISGNSISVYGKVSGNTTITVCAGSCTSLYVTVNYGSGSSIYFSPSSMYLNVGQSTSTNIYGGSGSYQVQTNSNSYVATTSISGNTLNVYGSNSGTTQITVCSYNYGNCGTLNVTVGGGSYNNQLNFINQSLPQPQTGTYYSTQLQVSGGTSPYTFNLASGSVPQGLTFYSNGTISGVPTDNQMYSFTVRVSDNYGRTAISQNYTLQSRGYIYGNTFYPPGSLINDSGTIYLIYKNTKSGFNSMKTFNGLGYKLSSVVNGTTSNLSNSGYIISSSAMAHPWGTWIKSGSTIYFVHESGLIPIPTYEIFLSNEGRDNLVVNANGYDFGRPILPVMTLTDYRLR